MFFIYYIRIRAIIDFKNIMKEKRNKTLKNIYTLTSLIGTNEL